KELAAAIERNRRAARQVDQQINKIIQREIELARKKAEEERKRKEEEERKREEERRKAAELAAKTQDPAGSGGTTYGNVKLNTGSGGEKPTPKETAPVASTKGSEDVKAVERP